MKIWGWSPKKQSSEWTLRGCVETDTGAGYGGNNVLRAEAAYAKSSHDWKAQLGEMEPTGRIWVDGSHVAGHVSRVGLGRIHVLLSGLC